MSKKRVLLLWERLDSIGGVETVLYNIVTRIVKEKFEVILGVYKDGKVRKMFEEEGIKVEIFDRKSKLDWSVITNLFKYLKKEKIDIVHTHSHFTGIVGRIAGKLAGVKVISTYHLPLDKDEYPFTTKLATKLTLFLSDKVTFVSKAVAKSFGKSFCFMDNSENRNKKFHVIYNGVDFGYIRNISEAMDKNSIRKSLNIQENDIFILTVGRLAYQKGQIFLVQAVEKLVREIPNIKLVIIGEGDLEKKLKDYINKNFLEEFVKILPPVEHNVLIQIISVSDIFALPSVYEGLVVVLLEALSLGKPIAATDVDGINEVIINDVNGILVEPKSSDSLYKALKVIILDNEVRKRIVCNISSTLEKFSIDKMIKSYIALYE